MKYNNKTRIEHSDYRRDFWNYVRGREKTWVVEDKKNEVEAGQYALPEVSAGRCEQAITEMSVMRKLATVVNVYNIGSQIYTADHDDIAYFVPETGTIELTDISLDFDRIPVKRNKLAVILKISKDLLSDAAFDLEGYMVKRLARMYANAEDNAFINGSGEGEPEGLLKGAETGCETSVLAYDEIVRLFLSVKPEYRENGVWLMNDETALTLRTLKDDAGNPLWNQASDTILGRPISFSRFMPSEGTPVAFGDLSYYWAIKRSPLMLSALHELFALNDQDGYVSYEFLDGKLLRPDAVKTISVGARG